MKAFNGDVEFKRQLIAAAIEHRKADDFISGSYAERGDGRFKGCSVGCSLYDVQSLRGLDVSYYGDHGLLSASLGVPEWLCRLQDAIFEGLPGDQRSRWTERLYAAIPVGADLEPVRHHLAIRRLERLLRAQQEALKKATSDHGLDDAIKSVIAALDQAISYHRAALVDVSCVVDWSAARAAAAAAVESAVAWAAESAVAWAAAVRAAESWSESLSAAAWSKVAWSAAQAAESAVAESESAAAQAAARSARSAAGWQQEADDLIDALESIS